MNKPRVNSDSQKQLDQAQEQFDAFHKSTEINPLELGGKYEPTAPQTEMSSKEIKKFDAPYIKPIRSINRPTGGKDGARVYWDEKFRPEHTRGWEYVRCIVENNEIIGEDVELWTSRWGCDPAHHWKIPTNKPIWIPRHVAEQVANCKYHRLRMEDQPTNQGGGMTFYGAVSVEKVVHRLDCRPATSGFNASGF